LTFGEEVELADLLAFVQRLPGVRSVKARRFRRSSSLADVEVRDRITLGPTEVAQLAADADFPELGTLRVLVVGLDEVDRAEFAMDGPQVNGGAS
jgi:hypothetical protein